MAIFDGFRDPGWNTYYGDQRVPLSTVSFDLTMAIVAYAAVVTAAAMALIVIGSRGKERWSTFLRLLVSVHTGVVIIVCVVGRYWQVSKVHSHSEYKAGVLDDIETDIGIRVGLKDVNVTLHAETGLIDYNEEFSLNHLHDIRDSYRDGLERGLPRPILHSLEYFYVDGGGLRWHRALRNAGHFAYILLWTSFVTWLLSNILLCFIISRGMLMLLLTGLLMVTACLVYHCMQSSMPLAIPYADGVLRLHYGWCFWLCLGAGIVACVMGMLFLLLNWRIPDEISRIFLLDYTPLEEIEANDCSPGPLKIDTPFSRRTARLIRPNHGGGGGVPNRGFILDDWPQSVRGSGAPRPTAKSASQIPETSTAGASPSGDPNTAAAAEANDTGSDGGPHQGSRSRASPGSIWIETEAIVESRRPEDEEQEQEEEEKEEEEEEEEEEGLDDSLNGCGGNYRDVTEELEFVDVKDYNGTEDSSILRLENESNISVESSC